jgi:hypothetical protein
MDVFVFTGVLWSCSKFPSALERPSKTSSAPGLDTRTRGRGPGSLTPPTRAPTAPGDELRDFTFTFGELLDVPRDA